MVKRLFRIESDRIKCFSLKKGPRQMVSIAGRLYRCDDDLMIRDINTGECAVIYYIDSTQPVMCQARIIDPDMTRAYIDSAKLAGNKKSIWANLTGSNAWKWLTAIIVVGCLLYGFLIGGHH